MLDLLDPPAIVLSEEELRTITRYRQPSRQLNELHRQGFHRARKGGSNPVTDIPTMTLKARTRYITDSELRRIKVAANHGEDGLRTRCGLMLCALIDMAYLTGQRIGDLLALEWEQVKEDGILFVPTKTEKSTGAAVLIEWTPRLLNVVERLRVVRRERRGFVPQIFTTQAGAAYTLLGSVIGLETCRQASRGGRRALP